MEAPTTSGSSTLHRYERRTTVALALLTIFYTVAGYFHIRSPEAFVRVTPAWVPNASRIIFVTGVCELAGVAVLLLPQTRKIAAVALAIYAVCVFPANIQHAVQDLSSPHGGLGWLYHAPRLFAQPFIVWWTLYAGGLVGGLNIPGKMDRRG